MDSSAFATAAGRYHVLRGLFLLPAGLAFIAAGAFDMPPIGEESVSPDAGYFLAALAAAAVGGVAIDRYYRRRFGSVDPSTRTKVKIDVFTVLAAVALCIGMMIDTVYDLPVSAYGAAFAIAWLCDYHVLVGLRPHHRIFLGGCGIVCLVPMLGGVDDKISAAMKLEHLATGGTGAIEQPEDGRR
jgi:uncharacterized membrane protein YiaA